MQNIDPDCAEKTIRALGLILSNSNVYGQQHGVTRNATDACFQHLSALWQAGEVTIQIAENDLSVNGVSVEGRSPVLRAFIEHLQYRDISNFSLKPALTREQFSGFIDVLLAKPDELQQLGGFNGALAAVGFTDVISARKITYMEVNEDEIVVDKQQALLADAVSEAERASARQQEAAAFFRGDGSVDSADAATSLRQLGEDQLSSLIVESAQAKGSENEDLAPEIVASLNRLYQAMTSDPTFHTQKTKKQIHKTLVLLEKELLGKLQTKQSDASPDDIQAIKDAIETMEDELTIDALSQEYVKRRSAIGTSEKRILRFMKNKSVETIEESDLKSRLIEGGLAPEDWHDLLVKSGAVPTDGTTAADVADHAGAGAGIGQQTATFEHLTQLLHKIEADTGTSPAPEGAPDGIAEEAAVPPSGGKRAVMLRVPEAVLEQDLHAVQQEVNRIILNAEKRIEKLVNEVECVGKQQDGKSGTTISRKRLFEILAEIGQELCQPLAVINCSVDTILSGMLGDINKVQREMLDLSADSAQKMKVLIDRVIEIAGVPDDLQVNKQIQAALYE